VHRARIRAALIHLLISVAVALACAALVFGLWYPGPYRVLSGGRELFWILVTIDVIVGPLLTLVVFNVRKPRGELMRDLAVISILQAAALAYGAWTLFAARPVHLVFEVDRFRVVAAADIDPAELRQAPAALRQLPTAGPTVIAARRARTGQEVLDAVERAAAGVDIAMQPARWQAYDQDARVEALQRAKVWSMLTTHPSLGPALREAAHTLRRPPEGLALLPVQSRLATWSAVLDEQGEPVMLIPADSF
jgi:hypothetical protein